MRPPANPRLAPVLLLLSAGWAGAPQARAWARMQDADPAAQDDTSSPSPAPAPPVPLALVGATVHSMLPGVEPAPATILIEGDRIVSVGPEVVPPEGARVEVLDGLHLVPGLIDAAVNHDLEHDALYVAAGVTLVRDTGNDLVTVLGERQRARRDMAVGPGLLVAGNVIDGGTGATTEALVLRDGRGAREGLANLFSGLAREAERQGVPPETVALDFLSIHAALPEDAWREVLRFAHEEVSLEVWGPLPGGLDLATVVGAGQDGIFGLDGLLPPRARWDAVGAADLAPGIEALAAAGTKLTPMLGAYARLVAPRDPAQLALLGPHYEQAWLDRDQAWDAQAQGAPVAAWVAAQQAALRALHGRGVTLVPGSGAPHPWLAPGRGLLAELDLWVGAGLEPGEVLRLATAGAAEALGVAAEHGALAPGRLANVVALGTDPRVSLAGLRDPQLVVLRGRLLQPEELRERLEGVAAAQEEARRALSAPLAIEPPDSPPGDPVLEGYAETQSQGRRVTAERFRVVRTFDGRVAYCSRLVLPATATTAAHEFAFVQYFRDHRLDQFELLSGPADPEAPESAARLQVQGALMGASTRMIVQRRSQRGFVDNRVPDDALSLVDLSDVLTAIVVGQHLREGVHYVLGLEGGALEPVVDRWAVSVNSQDHGITVQTSRGPLAFALDERGVPVAFARRVGNGRTDLVLREVETFGGPGLPPEAARVFVAPPTEEGSDGTSDGAPAEASTSGAQGGGDGGR